MQVTKNTLSETKIELVISVDAKELEIVKQLTLEKMSKHVKTPGFRTGKAPLSVVEKQVDESQLQADVLQESANKFYQEAIVQQELRVLSNPEVEITKYVPFTTLEYKAVVEVMPTVKLGDYKKIKKTVTKTVVTAKEVNEVVENLRIRSAAKKEVTRAAKNGDELIIDFDGTDADGKAVAGASGKAYALTLGSNSFIPGFEEGLVGVKAGDAKDLKLSFPKDYHAASLAGSKITFAVTVQKVQELVPPAADDAFAATVGPFKTLDELKKDIKTQLQTEKDTESSNKVKDEIVEELVKKSTFSIPEVLITDQVNMLEHDFNQNLTYRGITQKEYLEQEGFKDGDEWKKKELVPQAERRVSVGIVLAEVAKVEGLQIKNEDLEQRIALYKRQYSSQADQFDTPEMQQEVASRLLTEKTVDLLYEIATK